MIAHRAIVVLLFALVACGKKGPPLAPLRVAPARIEDLAVAKTGEEVRAQFTVPVANADQSKPADLVAVEVYAISGKAEDPVGNALAGPQFLRLGEMVGRIDIAPPETPGETPDPTKGSVSERARAAAEIVARKTMPGQGTVASIVERLTKDDYTPFVHPDRKELPKPPVKEVLVRSLGPAPAEEPFSRTYVAVGVSRRGTQAALSNRVALPLADAPASPTAVAVTHAETSATITWTAPAGAWRRVQRLAEPGELEARSLAPNVIPTSYNVYRVAKASGGAPAGAPVPVNPSPIEGATFTHGPIALGEEGCYQVRAVRVYGSARLESAPSATVCTTFVDTFAPPPPANLAAVGSEGGVSLIWDPSSGTDVAGYLVLRGEIGPAGPPATLTPLMTQAIRETTYRDATPRRGARYVYAVVALDGATPPNRSVESNRVEEGAR